MTEETKEHALHKYRNLLFIIVDDVVLLIVAVGIIATAAMLLIEAATDLFFFSAHSIAHIISDLMFVLIIMELFRQVVRQINRHVFSLNPFLFIGVIASIRGLLLTQIKLAMGEIEWVEGIGQLVAHALIVLLLVACHYIYSKAGRGVHEKPSYKDED